MTADIPGDLVKLRDLYSEYNPANHSSTDELVAFLSSLIYKAAQFANEEGCRLIDMSIKDYMEQLRGKLDQNITEGRPQ